MGARYRDVDRNARGLLSRSVRSFGHREAGVHSQKQTVWEGLLRWPPRPEVGAYLRVSSRCGGLAELGGGGGFREEWLGPSEELA